jgi:hypothetical protein
MAGLSLHPRDNPNNVRIQNHDIFRYGLTFEDQSRVPIDFYPDYVLCLEGERWIPPGTLVFLLRVTSGVHLVLKEKEYFGSGWRSRCRGGLGILKQPSGTEMFLDYANGRRFVHIGVLRTLDLRRTVLTGILVRLMVSRLNNALLHLGIVENLLKFCMGERRKAVSLSSVTKCSVASMRVILKVFEGRTRIAVTLKIVRIDRLLLRYSK